MIVTGLNYGDFAGAGADACLVDNSITAWFLSQQGCPDCNVSLSCECGPELTAATAPAENPFLCADEPGSESFIGFYVTRVDGLDSIPYSREVFDDPACAGGSFGRGIVRKREVVIELVGIGSTCEGAAWGRRLLNKVFYGNCGRGSCEEELVLTTCCDGVESVWNLEGASPVGPIQFENICGCTMFRATVTLFTDPDFIQCVDSLEVACDVSVGACTPGVCVDPEAWAFDAFPDITNCGVTPSLIDSECDFNFEPPVSVASQCVECFDPDLADWGPACVITALDDDLTFDVALYAGTADASSLVLGIFTVDPATQTNGTVPPLFTAGVSELAAGSVLETNGGQPFQVLSNVQIPAGLAEGDSVLPCGGTYYVALRQACTSASTDARGTVRTFRRRVSL